MTHPCCLDGICDFDEVPLVFGRVLALDKHLDGEPAALDLVQVFGCRQCQRIKQVAIEPEINQADLSSES